MTFDTMYDFPAPARQVSQLDENLSRQTRTAGAYRFPEAETALKCSMTSKHSTPYSRKATRRRLLGDSH